MVEGDAVSHLDVHHAWLLEDLPGGRLRILTQKTQNGAPAKALAKARLNPMINGHQDWLDGLVTALRRGKQGHYKNTLAMQGNVNGRAKDNGHYYPINITDVFLAPRR